ncbi:MDMC-like protein [Mya arenaria]|uniref:MDMC-like protein n=1 Tax=Mya arenaria TaxID=6604 RepID=A0ABY7DIR2_MYAAR|nr:O-methyltransferase MdmC-like [Mya arenaria]WAQ94910.1 MDMC-like protein [Mya arenaria]
MYEPAFQELNDAAKLCDEKEVDPEVKGKIEKALSLLMAREKYCDDVSSKPSEALATLQSSTLTYPFKQAYEEGKTVWNLSPRMMSGSLEGLFLQSIVSMSKAKRVLEVGMFTGYAALACAEVLPENGEVVTCEIDPFLETLAKSFFEKSPHGKKINVKVGPAKDTLEALADEQQQFDVVFIDADKKGYIDYFKTVVDRDMLTPGGTVVLDNAFLHGQAYQPESTNENGLAIRMTNEYINSRADLFKVLVPIRDGALVVRRMADMFVS